MTQRKTLVKASKERPILEKVFVVRRDVEGAVNFTDEIGKADDNFERVETLAKEPMLIYFTSGTTGYPKAVSTTTPTHFPT